jgi:hypothetical protein
MKNFFIPTCLLVLLVTTASYAAPKKGKSNPWVDVGLKGGYGISSLFNNNLLNEKNLQYALSTGYNGGLKVGLNLNTVIALNLEASMTQITQKYQGKHPDYLTWSNTVRLNYLEFPVVLKITKNEWSYVELGCKASMLQSAKDDTEEKTSLINSSNFSLIFGFGQTLFAINGLYVNIGPRITYGFSDIVNENGKSENFPFPNQKFGPADTKIAYKPTNAITANMMVSIDFDVAQMAKASCGRGRRFVLFKN